MKPLAATLAVVIAALAAIPTVQAHRPSDGFVEIEVGAERVSGRLDLALADLHHAVGLDADGDGAITWGEVKAAQPRISAYVATRFSLAAAGEPCPIRPGATMIETRGARMFAVLPFAGTCPGAAAGGLEIDYNLFFDRDPLHRGLVKVGHPGGVATAVLSPERRGLAIAPGGKPSGFASYLTEGIWHIWIGTDHVLFVLVLLLPAMFAWRAGTWHRQGTRAAIGRIVQVTGAFTLAHSITLGLATFDVVRLPERPLEAAIAASVALAAFNVIRPVVAGREWLLAFGFGLLHGFGFAGVLGELGLPAGAMATALLGFNIGVEVGQLAIVAAALPLLLLARDWPAYPRRVLPAGAAAIALVALVWTVERLMPAAIAGP